MGLSETPERPPTIVNGATTVSIINDPNTTHPVFFTGAAINKRLVQLSSVPTGSSNKHSKINRNVNSYSKLGFHRIRFKMSAGVMLTGKLVPHRASDDHVCVRLDGSGARVYLPMNLYNHKQSRLGWWMDQTEISNSEQKAAAHVTNTKQQSKEEQIKARMIHK